MQPAQEGILTRCRGFVTLLAAIGFVFAVALRHDSELSCAPGAAADRVICFRDAFRDVQEPPTPAGQSAAAPAVSVPNPTGLAAADDNVIEAIHVGKSVRGQLFVPVTIDSQQWWFVVDTGCSETVIDCEVAIHVGLIDQQDKPDRWKSVYRMLHGSVGNARLPLECHAMCFDLSHLRRGHRGYPICGILGMDFLSNYVVEIDLDAGELSFLKSVSESSGSEFRLSRDPYDRPLLRIAVAKDNDDWFVVDTGCSGPVSGAIRKRLFAELVAGKHLSDVRGSIPTMTFYGKRLCDEATLDAFQVGKFEHPGLKFISDGSVNLLGLGYLSRYVVVLDFPNNRLYLKDGIRYADPPAASAAYADARKAGSIDPADFSQADFQELFRKQAGLH